MDTDTMEEEEEEEEGRLIRERFRLSVISMANAQGKRKEMEVSERVVGCISEMALKVTQQLGVDVELFAHHASRVSVNMEDVILSAHRNQHLSGSLRAFAHALNSNKKRNKPKPILHVPGPSTSTFLLSPTYK